MHLGVRLKCLSSASQIPFRLGHTDPFKAQVMNEGPGHVPLHKIPDNMRKQLEWCHEAITAVQFHNFLLKGSTLANVFVSVW